MKKRERKIEALILFTLLSIVLINLVSATDIQLAKAEYYPSETIQADITGFFSGGLTTGKILLCRGSEVNPIAISSDLIQLQDKFLFYAIPSSSLTPGDYSLKIKSSTTTSCLSGIAFSKSLKIIAPTDKPYTQIDPGFITYSSNGEISMKVKGFVSIQKITANFAATGEAKNFTLVDSTTKTIYFSTDNLYGNIESIISIGSYNIPVYLSMPPAPEKICNQSYTCSSWSTCLNENQTRICTNTTLNCMNMTITETQSCLTNQTAEEEIIIKNELKFSPDSMNLVVLNNTFYEINFSIINEGNKTIKNLVMSSNSSEIILNREDISEISGYNSIPISINFKITQPLSSNMILTYKNQSILLPVWINITKNSSQVDINTITLEVSPEKFDEYINFSQKYKFNFTLENKANRTIEDITLLCKDENIKLDTTSISSIKQGKNTTIYFEVNTNETIENQIEINYENKTIVVPIIFREYKEEEYNLSDNLIFYPEKIDGTFFSGKEYFFSIILANAGEKDLEDIIISCENKNIEFTPAKIDLLKSYKKIYLNITINSEEDINTSLIAKWANQEIFLPIEVIITKTESEEEVYTGDTSYPTCLQNGGVTCKTGEKCNGILETDIRLPNCCKGTCQASSSSTTWIIGVILLVILGIGGFYFYSRYKNSKSESSNEILKSRAKDFEERMNPKEVRGGLSKI